MEQYDIYRDSVDCLPSCQLEVQLYQKKSQDLADNREKLSSLLKEVCIGQYFCHLCRAVTLHWIHFHLLVLFCFLRQGFWNSLCRPG
jgi:hypothetical protein